MQKVKVGLIGLGAMGRGAAVNLIEKDYEVIGYDVRDESLSWLRERGGTPCSSLSELATQAQIVISFVINSSQTENILFGDDGLVGRLEKESIVIACSTMDPAYVQDLGDRLQKHSITLIDAPVTGGPEGALKGSLTIMGSGDRNAFEKVKPVLEAIGSRVYHLGEAGSGAKMKVVNQLLVGANLVAAAEAMALAKHLGLPIETTLEILSSGAANSWMLTNRGPKMISEKYDEVNATVDIFLKDLSLVLDATRGARFPAPFAHNAYLAFIEASGRGFGMSDGAVVMSNYSMESK
jgi:3-hydroxyisobutyrate dehydrogenase